MSAKKTAQNNSDGKDRIDWNTVFTSGRIKTQLMNDDRVGRLTNKATERVGILSALFVHKLASEARKSSNNESIITLEDVREAATHHDFLAGALDCVSEQSAPKRPKKKKPKLDSEVKDPVVQNAVAASAVTEAASFRPEITVDEDDYD